MSPNPKDIFPNKNISSVCFVKNIIDNPNIIIGDYTYYSDDEDIYNFKKNITHHYDFIGDKLIIGKFCAIAKGVQFIMNGANHCMCSASTYPFYIMGWEKTPPVLEDMPLKGDTVIGNDVWIGQNAVIMPGINIGDGAIIGANSVVAKDIPAYAVAAGNPCCVRKMRFPDEIINILLEVKWWDWSADKIFENLNILSGSDLSKLKTLLK